MRGDGVYRRPGSPYWYFKAKVDGKWKEVSTKAKDYQQARKIRSDHVGRNLGELSHVIFKKVARRYLESIQQNVSAETVQKETNFLARPTRLLGHMPCDRICELDITRLQKAMQRDGLKNSYVNLVAGSALRVLSFAKVNVAVKRLKENPAPIAKVLTPAQKQHLFQVAASNPAWLAAYAAALISVSTTLRGCEVKSLRWSDVDLFKRELTVPKSKTAEGLRRVPLNASAMLAFGMLRERSQALGCDTANSYVFPSCENGHIDPRYPQQSWRSAWRALTAKAGFPTLRFHDMRHQCITELAEGMASDQTIMSIAGHLSLRMLKHYSHIRMDAKREALDSLPAITAEPKTTIRPN